MHSGNCRRLATIGVLALLAAGDRVAASDGVPRTVSPGADAGSLIDGGCPAFSWSTVDGAPGYELVVDRVGSDRRDSRLVLRQLFVGDVASWTPPLEHCLEADASYAWRVRVAGPNGASEWSAPRLFKVAGAPTDEEFAAALEVIRRHLPVGGSAGAPLAGSATGEQRPDTLPAIARATGEVEMSNGPPPTVLTVDGGVEATSFSGSGSSLTDLEPANIALGTAAIDITGNAATASSSSALSCSDCLTGAEIDVGAVGSSELADDAIDGDAIGTGAVGSDEVADSSLGKDDLGDDSVGASELQTDSVGSDEIASQAVGSDEIVNSSVTTGDLAFDPATQTELDAHEGPVSAHHAATVDTTCNSITCDGTDFTSLPWASLTGKPSGLDDGDDDTIYAAGGGLTLAGTTFSYTGGPAMAPMNTGLSTVHSAFSKGAYSAITIGADGFPVISYFDDSSDNLMVAKCNDAACSGGDETISTVDSSGSVGRHTSITLGADGFPVISYQLQNVVGGNSLKVAKCDDAACAGGGETITTVDAGNLFPAKSVGSYTSIALGTDGLPVISYYHFTGKELWVVKCDDAACAGGGETKSKIDTTGFVGEYTSITLGTDGFPVISYFDTTNDSLKVAKCNDAACSGANETVSTVDAGTNVGEYTSIALGTDGLPVIGYRDVNNTALKVAKCADPACSGGGETLSTVDNSADVGQFTSITVAPDGLPVISYYDLTNDDLKVAKCNDPACSGGDETIVVVASSDDQGRYSSITIGADGLPVISFKDETFDNLEVAHCGSAFCVPYFKRR